MWMCSHSYTISWNDCLCCTELSLLLCQRSANSGGVGPSLHSFFCSTGLFFYSSSTNTLPCSS
jgi:hypothetical protein